MMTEIVDDHAVVVGDLDRHALGQVLGTKLLLHKVHEVTLHAQNVRHLAGGRWRRFFSITPLE